MFAAAPAPSPRARVWLRAAAVAGWCAASLACSAKSRDDARTPEGAARTPEGAAARSVPIPDETGQLVLGVTENWQATAAELRLYERAPGGAWVQIGEPWPGRVGRAGLAWGRGLHGDGAPHGEDGPVKAEGDGRAPAGVFAIGRAYGYDERAPEGSQLPYAQLTDGWRCVDDPASEFYNRVLDATGSKPDWSSAETMRRNDDLYTWVVEIDHNHGAAPAGDASANAPVPGRGSCIFFHVWADEDSPTAGCTAMSLNNIEGLLRALRPRERPVYSVLPRSVYQRVATDWALPPP